TPSIRASRRKPDCIPRRLFYRACNEIGKARRMTKGVIEARTQAERDGNKLSVIVLDYVLEMKRLLDEAKTNPHFADADWAPLKAMVAADQFRRVGVFLEDIDWKQYESFLTLWAKASDWVPTFRRITEAPGVVLLELAEWSNAGGKVDEIKSV